MRKFLLTSAMLLNLSGLAYAQSIGYGSSTTCGNCGYVTISNGCCVGAPPDEATLAAWAAKKAVASQLDWFDEKKVEKLERSELDAMQARVDALCKWAKTLSNHIFASAYAEWGVERHQQNRRSSSRPR